MSTVTYRISLHDGQSLDGCHSRDAAAEAIRAYYQWPEVVLSESYQDDDGTAWSAYATQEECDEDQEGAYAPRIIRVRLPRYTIHYILDADCTATGSEVLASTDDEDEAKRLAARHSGSLYGAAIVDHETGETDFGGHED